MPKLSVWLVRAALLHMGVGFFFGALLLHHKGIPLYGWTWQLLNPHMELMIFGWTMQFAVGMAFWILPRFSTAARYGREALGWWGLSLLNGGVICTALSQWWGLPEPALIGRVATLVSVVLFVRLLWPRVKPFADMLIAAPPSRHPDGLARGAAPRIHVSNFNHSEP